LGLGEAGIVEGRKAAVPVPRTLESELEFESMIGGGEVYSHRKSREIGRERKDTRQRAARLDLYPYWLAGATAAPGDDLEVRQPPTITLEGSEGPREYDLRGCEHC
jgi:hypothetical protein